MPNILLLWKVFKECRLCGLEFLLGETALDQLLIPVEKHLSNTL